MKIVTFFALVVFALTSCSKTNTTPPPTVPPVVNNCGIVTSLTAENVSSGNTFIVEYHLNVKWNSDGTTTNNIVTTTGTYKVGSSYCK